MAVKISLFFSLLLLLSFTTVVISDPDGDVDCVYTIYVRTGSIFKAGTDSIIGVKMYNAEGEGVEITNLESWGGLMGPDYNYFERGNLDIFSGRGRCLSAPMCYLNLTSDGSGPHHGWYCNYVEVTMTGVHTPCAQQQFTVEQWLATDVAPWELTAVRDYCPSEPVDRRRRDSRLIKSVSSSSSSV